MRPGGHVAEPGALGQLHQPAPAGLRLLRIGAAWVSSSARRLTRSGARRTTLERHVAAHRESGQREPVRRFRQDTVGHRGDALVAGQVGHAYVGRGPPERLALGREQPLVAEQPG
jgi:hypothetical protein